MRIKSKPSLAIAISITVLFPGCWQKSTQRCEEIRSAIIESKKQADLLHLMEEIKDKKNLGEHPAKYPFGRGGFAAVGFNIPEGIGLKDDAEIQLVTNSSGQLIALQLIDSQGDNVVILDQDGRWYGWPKSSVAKINSRIGVVCRSRD